MKIMYLIDTNPINGGAPISTVLIANEMAKQKNDVVIVMPYNEIEGSLDKKIKQIKISRFVEYFPFDVIHPIKAIFLAKELNKIIKNESPDIIHAHMPRGARAIGLLRILRLLPSRIKLIYTDREHVVQFRKIIRVLYSIFIAKQYEKIICISEESAKYWREKTKKPNVYVVPNTAGGYYELYDSKLHFEMRNKFNISDDKISIMFAGRMVPWKNWGLAKEIINALKAENIHYIFVISFTNKEQEDNARKFVTEVEALGIEYDAIYNAPQTLMNEIYYASDIFILTSDRESFGRTAVEAMSRKCAVIGRNVGGLPEVISKEENILSCDPKQFYARIIDYIDNPNTLKQDKEWFYNRFIQNYKLDNYRDNHLIVYQEECK